MIGKVIADPEPPTTNKFYFLAVKEVKKGQYIKSGDTVAFVSEIFKTNRYFEDLELAGEIEKNQKAINEWECTVGEAKIVGRVKEQLSRAFYPLSPGAPVEIADNETIGKVLGFEKGGIYIGEVEHHNLKTMLSLTRLFQKHVALLAMSGAGKSHLTSVIIEELLKRTPEQGRLAVIVLDVHGEYIGFGKDEKYAQNTRVFEEITFSLPLLTTDQFLTLCPTLTQAGREAVKSAFNSLKGEIFTLEELKEKIMEEQKAKQATRDVINRVFDELEHEKIFGEEHPDLEREVKPGKLIVLDLSECISHKKRQMIAALTASKLFTLRRAQKIPPFVLIIEEAHNFANEGSHKEAIARSIIETIAREGRKFGASLFLISQRPVNLSTTALSQCNTHILMRITNPNDLEHIKKSAEGLDSKAINSITSLMTGEAIIVGEAVNFPVFVKVRKRMSKKIEKGKPLEEQAREYEQKIKEKEQKAEAFL